MIRKTAFILLLGIFTIQLSAQKLTRFMLGTTISGKTAQFEQELVKMGFVEQQPNMFMGKFKCSMAMVLFDSFDRWMADRDYDIIVSPVSRGNVLVAAHLIVYSEPTDTLSNYRMFMDICKKLNEDIFYEYKGPYDDLLGQVDRTCMTFVQKDIEGKYDSDEFLLKRIVQVIPEDFGVVISYINGWNLGLK